MYTLLRVKKKRKISEKQMGFLKQRKKSDIRYGRDTISIEFNFQLVQLCEVKEKERKRKKNKEMNLKFASAAQVSQINCQLIVLRVGISIGIFGRREF